LRRRRTGEATSSWRAKFGVILGGLGEAVTRRYPGDTVSENGGLRFANLPGVIGGGHYEFEDHRCLDRACRMSLEGVAAPAIFTRGRSRGRLRGADVVAQLPLAVIPGESGYPVRRSLSIQSQLRWNTGSFAFAGDDDAWCGARHLASDSIFKQQASVIASVSEAIHESARMDCFVAYAPLRKRFAFVAGNDDLGQRTGH
jgi:hypothetical protein